MQLGVISRRWRDAQGKYTSASPSKLTRRSKFVGSDSYPTYQIMAVIYWPLSRVLRRRLLVKNAWPSSFTRGRAGQILIAICAVVLVASLVVGFSVDAKSMGVNLLAGVACIALGIVVAIWVTDRYLRHVARLRWSRVESATYRAMAAHLCDAMVGVLVRTPVLRDFRPMTPIQEGRDRPDSKTIEGLTELAAMLRAVPHPGNNDLSDAAISYYEENKWDLDQLCESLLSRLIEYSDAQDLVDALTELDGVRRALRTSIIAHRQAVTGGVFVHLAELVDASAKVYLALLNHWKPTMQARQGG